MASPLSVILVVAFACSFSHHFFAVIARKELRSKLLNQETLERSSRVDPSRVVQISWQPRVFVYRNFLSDEECDHLISTGRKMKKDMDPLDNSTKGLSMNSQNNSSNVKDDLVSRIEERISAWSFLPRENSIPLQIQHFTSEQASGKYDYLGNHSTSGVNEPLMATVILHLSDVSQGGDIYFPDSKIKSSQTGWLKPTKGNAIIFFNVHLNASPDKSSRHERRPVLDTEMWCAVKLFYLKPIRLLELPAGPDDEECSDQDDNCPQWAAVGECQRNPVFMVGSPDYYGTCRKSCKVCR